MKIKFFDVKSRTNKFTQFKIGNNGLSYLIDEIDDLIYIHYKINIRKNINDILIRSADSPTWYKITTQEKDSDYLLVEDYTPKTLSVRF